MKKWNFQTRKYEQYNVPSIWKIGLYSTDSDELVNCAKCGKLIKVANKYRSLEIYNEKGQEYAVCKCCFKEEWIKKQIATTPRIVQIEDLEI